MRPNSLYKFRTFRTSYYFPEMTREISFMFELYASYGGILSKLYWWLFRHCVVVRLINSIKIENVNFPFKQIAELEKNGSIMAFNLGTPGKEQKISILGYNQIIKEPFFAKFSTKKDAIELTRNEVKVYKTLNDTNLTPKLIDYTDGENYIWMKTTYVNGTHMSSILLTKEIVDIAINLTNYHLDKELSNRIGLRTSLSHGDFCPWNMLVNDGKIQLIDWEMAAERPLGYDIFKFVWQVARLFSPQKTMDIVIKENETMINYYFSSLGITIWTDYYNNFRSTRF